MTAPVNIMDLNSTALPIASSTAAGDDSSASDVATASPTPSFVQASGAGSAVGAYFDTAVGLFAFVGLMLGM